jgi:biopolymer transport protein ExbB
MWSLLLLGQTAVEAAGGAGTADAVKVQSIWDFVVKGGPVMIPLGICSLVALTIILERLMSLRRSRVIPPDFLAGLRKRLSNGADGRDEALEYCHTNGSPIAMVLAAGIKQLDAPREWLEKCMQEAGQREVLQLRKYLRALALIVSISPMLGLLGTVTGMVRAFQTVAASSEALGKAELLAKGIYEALITTVAGLTIAIPVMIAFHWFSARVERLVTDMDHLATEFVEEYASSETARVGSRPRLQPLAESDEPVAAEEEVEAAASA